MTIERLRDSGLTESVAPSVGALVRKLFVQGAIATVSKTDGQAVLRAWAFDPRGGQGPCLGVTGLAREELTDNLWGFALEAHTLGPKPGCTDESCFRFAGTICKNTLAVNPIDGGEYPEEWVNQELQIMDRSAMPRQGLLVVSDPLVSPQAAGFIGPLYGDRHIWESPTLQQVTRHLYNHPDARATTQLIIP